MPIDPLTVPIDHSTSPRLQGPDPRTFGQYDQRPSGPIKGLRESLNDMSAERAALLPYRDRAMASLSNQASRQAKNVRSVATMRAAQGDRLTPTTARGALDAATRRMRARQGIVNRGDAAVKNQELKDRMAVAQQQMLRRGTLLNALQKYENLQQGVNLGVQDANDRAKASQYSMFGSVIGMGAAAARNAWNNRTPVSQPMDEGTAAADYQNADPNIGVNYSNFENDPTVYT